MEKKSMGTFLAALRKASGMTQKQLADQLNVSDKAVSRWERDENAPDLSLIPVIAEIFGVTSDELLRGERAVPGENPERAAIRKEKQIQRILDKTLTTYKIQCAISFALAVLGLIAAMIGNLGFLRARVGFLCGCIFFVIAALCQVIWGILAHSRLNQEEFEDELLASVRKKITYAAQATYTAIFAVFTFTLPLVVLTWDAFIGLNLSSWCLTGLAFVLAAGLIALIVCAVINWKKGYWLTGALGKLKVRCIALALLIAAVLGIGHIALAQFLSNNRHLLTDFEEFSNWEDFKEYMQTPLDSGGAPMEFLEAYMDGSIREDGARNRYLVYGNEQEEYRIEYDNLFEEIYVHADDEKPIVKYRNLNMSVSSMEFSGDEDLLPVRVFTQNQVREANRKGELYCALYALLYLAAPGAGLLFYRKKKKKLA